MDDRSERVLVGEAASRSASASRSAMSQAVMVTSAPRREFGLELVGAGRWAPRRLSRTGAVTPWRETR